MSVIAPRPRPLSELSPGLARSVHGVLTDIDDTLTRDGAIEPEALAALQALRDAAIPVIAITGRPMGWSEPFARDWPIDAIVAENGAVALFRDAQGLRIEYAQDEATRTHNAMRLRRTAQRVLAEVPGATLAQDSAGRVTDIAIDHSEFAHLSQPQIDAVLQVMRAEGMNATVSSIHINGWYGEHDKLSGARWIVQRLLGRVLDGETPAWAYVGDSTNDQTMFGHFPVSVGVANLMQFADRLHTWPAYLAPGERGQGFADVAGALCAARAADKRP
ncbi:MULTISPECIES: HAD-IIB family hydrolase [unclassified Rhizobacter]|uniref:HAD-IIB family hydrolase n=1 Tax=unclassified Rhizobacter TaxID=2640088 RepID=UPI0006F21D08|nr:MULTISPECIES: HAD-IIB family hydrolase [unclassified Rhizobacter]KQU67857.1 HAD family hydrolase [Rhizobacter sp. Root29]KQW15256.1 HAD family hydrolase [Rhizobacter sp. Root1238]KRB24420.1 HAD family hydrolase [Rhizobacter sp. Root16D2]